MAGVAVGGLVGQPRRRSSRRSLANARNAGSGRLERYEGRGENGHRDRIVAFDANFHRVPIPGVHNPIHYITYLGAVLAYYAVVLGILWVAFFVNGLRLESLARLRMLLIAGGFFLLFVAICLIPRILFGKPDTGTNKAIITTVEYLAIISAPLLLVGFSPPKWLSARYSPPASA